VCAWEPAEIFLNVGKVRFTSKNEQRVKEKLMKNEEGNGRENKTEQ